MKYKSGSYFIGCSQNTFQKRRYISDESERCYMFSLGTKLEAHPKFGSVVKPDEATHTLKGMKGFMIYMTNLSKSRSEQASKFQNCLEKTRKGN